MKLIRPLIVTFLATAAVCTAASAQAQVNVGVTLGYPGGYGIAQPSYVAPAAVYVQPAPVYVQRNGYAYPDWREREHEHNRYYREHHDNHGYYGNGWRDHDGDRYRDHERGEHRGGHEDRDGWRR